MAKNRTAITPTREQDYNEWYQQVVKSGDLAEHSPVRGCMVIKPWGYAIWENIQRILNDKFAAKGVENFYCPLFIPKSYLEREAEHIDGFATECAVVTHHRLEKNDDGELIPAGELEEPLIVRPTSETIIGEMFAGWVQSHRDLPLKLNQWANIVRWEMRTRLFLRTSEFLWQEGHTAHSNKEEAATFSKEIVEAYADFSRNYLAMPVTIGEKSRNERFPGAKTSFTIEALMQDNKALQAGTSHYLGQTFAEAFNINFSDKDGALQTAWTTSWGVSTRLIGGLIMTHSDDDGLLLPPKIAPRHVVILPIPHKAADPSAIYSYCEHLAEEISKQSFAGQTIRVQVDQRDQRPGDKAWGWVKKGAPIRIEIGPKELENNVVYFGRRDQSPKDKKSLDKDAFVEQLPAILEQMQQNMYDNALRRTEENTTTVTTRSELEAAFSADTPGFVKGYWLDSAENDTVEKELKEKYKITIRCLLTDCDSGTCMFSGKDGANMAIFAKAY